MYFVIQSPSAELRFVVSDLELVQILCLLLLEDIYWSVAFVGV